MSPWPIEEENPVSKQNWRPQKTAWSSSEIAGYAKFGYDLTGPA
jgi:hypothetical protein